MCINDSVLLILTSGFHDNLNLCMLSKLLMDVDKCPLHANELYNVLQHQINKRSKERSKVFPQGHIEVWKTGHKCIMIQ